MWPVPDAAAGGGRVPRRPRRGRARGWPTSAGGIAVVKWWDRFWSAVWMIGSAVCAYVAGRWVAVNASPADLGGLRYGLIAFSGLFGLLVGAFCLSIAVIAVTTGLEWLFAKAGHPFHRPAPERPEMLPPSVTNPVPAPADEEAPATSPATEHLAEAGGD
jgi:hypothetical protein